MTGRRINFQHVPWWNLSAPENRYVESILRNPEPLRRSHQLPGVGNRILLEIITEREIAEHFEKSVMPLRKPHIFQIVVLSARAHALLRRRGPRVIPLFEAKKDVFELVHPRVRKQQRRVAVRHQRRAPHAAVSLALKKLQKPLAYLVAGQVTLNFPMERMSRRVDLGRPLHGGIMAEGKSQRQPMGRDAPPGGGSDLWQTMRLKRQIPLYGISTRTLGICARGVFGEAFAGERAEFAADNVGGEAGAEEAAVDGGHFLFIDFAAVGTELAFDPLADRDRFVGMLGDFFEGGFDVAVGNAPGAEVAGDTELSLFAGFGTLSGELFGVTRVIDQAVFLQPRHHHLDQQLVNAPSLQLLLHLVHGVRSPHQRAHGYFIQLRFGLNLVSLLEHGKSIEASKQGGKEVSKGEGFNLFCNDRRRPQA